MDSEQIITIKSIDGYTLSYSKKYLENNPFIKGTLIDKFFFGSLSFKSELVLEYKSSVVEHLIPLIREGVIDTQKTGNWLELSNMLDFISGRNQNIANITAIINNGAMDLLGRKMPSNFNRINMDDLFYLSPYDYEESEKRKKSFINKINARDAKIKISLNCTRRNNNSLSLLEFSYGDQWDPSCPEKISLNTTQIFDSVDSYINEIVEAVMANYYKR